MKLVERISQQSSTTPVPFQRSLIGNKKTVVKDVQAEGFQQLKLSGPQPAVRDAGRYPA